MHNLEHFFNRMIFDKTLFNLLFLFCLIHLSGYQVQAHSKDKRMADSLQNKLKLAGNDSNKVKLLLKISKTFTKDDTLSSLSYARQSINLSDQIGWTKGRLAAMMYIGEIYGDANDGVRAIAYWRESATVAAGIRDTFNMAELYNYIALLYQADNRFDSCLLYYQLCLSLRKEPRLQLPLLANIGVVYDNLGDYPRALENYLHAIKLNQTILGNQDKKMKEDSLTHAGLLYSIGDIYLEMFQYDKGFENYNEVLSISKQLKDSMFEMMAFMGIGKTLSMKGNFAGAAEYYENALIVSRATHDPRNESDILKDLSNIYIRLGDADKALSYIMSAKQLAEPHQYDNLSKIFTTLGKIYADKKNYQASAGFLQQAIDIGKKLGSVSDQRDAWQVLSSMYEDMHQPVQALNAYQSYIILRDSVYNVDKARQMTSTYMQFKFDSQQLADSLRQSLAFDLKLQRQRVYTISSIATLALVLLMSFFIYKGYSKARKSNTIISKANETINQEKQVSENLLLNILPRDVADELKSNGKVQAKLFDDVTVLFTDFVNFTNTAERLSPQQLIEELDTCFQAFDVITTKYQVEKIKTVGDAYLAVSGLPHAHADHATEIVKAALEMRTFMLERRKKLGDLTFEVRLGIHSGKVIAGIVGMKKFAYDVWGDTVNIAARMEQSSDVGRINISHHTYELVKDSFPCSYRGELDAKNKGKMKMYFVEA